MRLNELTGYKRLQDRTRSELVHDVLVNNGYAFIGGGDFAEVYHRPGDDFVYKIYPKDHCYDLFLDFAFNNHNPHYPKVYFRKYLKAFWKRDATQINENLRIVKIEYIPHEIDPRDWEVISYAILYGGPEEDYSNKEVLQTRIAAHRPTKRIVDQLSGLHQAWAAAVDGTRCNPDLHIGNLRMRNDGTVVIIDPVWHGETPYTQYDDWRKSMIDHDPEEITGPAWKHRKQREEWTRRNHEFSDDDIPF